MKKILGLIASIALAAPTISQATPVFWEINAGGFGSETSWSIAQSTGGTFSVGGSSLSSYTNYTFNWDLSPGDFVLSMWDSWGDGLDNGGHAKLIVDGVTLVDCGSCFGSSYQLAFAVPASDVSEPFTLALMGLGLAGLGLSRKRKAA
jgi:hypothetical protein